MSTPAAATSICAHSARSSTSATSVCDLSRSPTTGRCGRKHGSVCEDIGAIEAAVLADKQPTGRPGMSLWQMLVLGVVRLGLDADWDRMEDLANHHRLVRQMLQVPVEPWGEDDQTFGHQTLRDNVALLDDELLQQINARIAAAGREMAAAAMRGRSFESDGTREV